MGIIGGGPAGLTLASLLAMRGVDVTLFEDGKRPDLIVGESLVPAIVPVLRRLGIEERVAAIGLHKPGVSFTLPGRDRVNFDFRNVARCQLPTYAYNVPRPAFDDVLDARATELGARRCKLAPRSSVTATRLCGWAKRRSRWPRGWKASHPHLLVDSTGRSRLFARLLEIPATTGPRRDVAHFAHFEGFAENEPARAGHHRLAGSRMELAHPAAGTVIRRSGDEQGRGRPARFVTRGTPGKRHRS